MVDRLMRIFESTDSDFSTNGIGTLSDTIKCEVEEKLNNKYEMTMTYPVSGKNYREIQYKRIVVVKPNPYSDPQPFRIYGISKPLNGEVTVNAEHISYDLSRYTAAPFSAGSVLTAFQNLVAAMDVQSPFMFWTDKTTSANIETIKPLTVRSILGGIEGSILDTYRGEYEFDGYTVKLWNNRGSNRGVTIRYGKNLTSLKQDENCSNVYNAVRPFWYKEGTEGGLVVLSQKLVYLVENPPVVQILLLDLSSQLQEKPTEEQLYNATMDYINTHNLSIPEVSLDVSFVNLSETTDYENIAVLERVQMGDTLTIQFPKLGVDATAKVIATTYDVLSGRYSKVSLGSEKANLTTTIAAQNKITQNITTHSELEQAILNATNAITGYSGGYVVLDPKNNPSRILIMDTPDKATAVDVWQWNVNGLGHSSNGINGPYDVAITQGGSINANFLTSGLINGNMIEAGTITSGSISQEYTANIDNNINDTADIVRQEFTAADAQLSNSITEAYTSMINGDVELLNSSISELRQSIDGIIMSFSSQVVGGINKIENSCGLNGKSDDWLYTGEIDAIQNAEAQTSTVSGSMWRIGGSADPEQAILSQKISTVIGTSYSLTFKCKFDTADRYLAVINNGENDLIIFDTYSYIVDENLVDNSNANIIDHNGDPITTRKNLPFETNKWKEYNYSFVAASDYVTLELIAYGRYMYASDLMFVEGITKSNWTPAPNEIYTTNIKIDKRGINITNTESSTQTIIDNTQFAVLHNDNVVLTVNKDLTTLQKTECKDYLTIGKGRFVPSGTGLDLVLLD